MKQAIDFIWNITLVCPWDCEFCCTDAVNVKSSTGKKIQIIEKGLSETYEFKNNIQLQLNRKMKEYGIKPNIYDKALLVRQERNLEPSYSEKIRVLENLDIDDIEIDFAGGDPLSCYENFFIVQTASKELGKNNISITSTGHSLSRYPLELLCQIIGCYEFTFDEPTEYENLCRPKGYNKTNLFFAQQFARNGTKTKCQIPIHKGNLNKFQIDNICKTLTNIGVDEILLMRTFPVGRGMVFNGRHNTISQDKYKEVIGYFIESCHQNRGPKVRLQCALKHLFYSDISNDNPCDLMRTSFGINYQGKLLASAWANNHHGKPFAEFQLGSLINSSFSQIADTDKFKRYSKRLDENWGHCKIFSYVNSKIKNEDAVFFKNDELYI